MLLCSIRHIAVINLASRCPKLLSPFPPFQPLVLFLLQYFVLRIQFSVKDFIKYPLLFITELFRQTDENSFDSANVAEPVRVFILNHFAD